MDERQDATPLVLVARQAREGDEAALRELVVRIQDRIYGLAIRMTGSPPDAQDAAQEILLKVVTNLASFRGDAAFETWVHRVAVNHLLNLRKRSDLERSRTFEAFGAEIDAGVEAFSDEGTEPVDRVSRHEVRLSCTHGMLVCLERAERVAFILGAIFELTAPEAAEILEIEPPAFRQRLSRARRKLEAFMRDRCGVFDARNRCRCARQAPVAIRVGALDPRAPLYACHPVAGGGLARDEEREFNGLLDVAAVFHTQPPYLAPGQLLAGLRQIVRGGSA